MSIQPLAAQPRGGWNGFTLIELLVVISVIGILASLIVGVSGVATSKARVSQVQALLNKVEQPLTPIMRILVLTRRILVFPTACPIRRPTSCFTS